MTDRDWEVLLPRIKSGKCTPFLGAGVNFGILPLGGEIACDWATKYEFPLRDADDLARVAQFVAVDHNDKAIPKGMMLERLKQAPRPDFSQPDPRLDCLRALAELPLPVYLTTNYDDLIVEALRHVIPKKNPRREICRWSNDLKGIPSAFDGLTVYEPDPTNPVVFHLHGSDESEDSLVLTEDDYIDFLVNMSRDQNPLPSRIQRALTEASLLFIGYSLRDINFRVIYRGLVQKLDGSRRKRNLSVQLTPPDDCLGDPAAAEKYLEKYFGDLNVGVYWGTASGFAKELRKRWREYHDGSVTKP